MWPFKYPYTNFHELNLDWILAEVQKIGTQIGYLNNKIDSLPGVPEGSQAFYNVESYGAKHNGVADDADAIQNCIDSAMEHGGGTVLFPAGDYLLSHGIIVRPHTPAEQVSGQDIHFLKMDQVQLVGLGNARIIAKTPLSAVFRTDDYSYPGAVGSYSNFYTFFSNLIIDGNGSVAGILLKNALHSVVNECRIDGCMTGVEINGYGEITISDNVIRASNRCIYSTHDGDSLYIANDLYSDTAMIVTEGYGGSSRIIGNTFTKATEGGTPYAICIMPKPGENNNSYYIAGNSFDFVKYCVYGVGGNEESERINNIVITGNKISPTASMEAFEFNRCDNIMIVNHSGFAENKPYKFLTANDCKNIIVDGNVISSTVNAISNYRSGIQCRNNVFDAVESDSILCVGNCTGTVIDNNVFNYSNHGAFYLTSDSTGVTVANNLFVGFGVNPKGTNEGSGNTVNTDSFVTSV